jgi:cell division septum initiation protein DivIVA
MTDVYDDEPDLVASQGEELNAEDLVRQDIDLVATAKAMPLSASVLVSRDELIDLLDAAVDRLPAELREARWLLRERDEFMAERSREAAQLMEDVRVQAERMVSRTEIVRQARQTAQRILDDANEEARRIRHETEDYCDKKLAGMEIVLDRVLRTVTSGRQKLQATAAPTDIRETAPAEDAGADDGFFDQDLS